MTFPFSWPCQINEGGQLETRRPHISSFGFASSYIISYYLVNSYDIKIIWNVGCLWWLYCHVVKTKINANLSWPFWRSWWLWFSAIVHPYHIEWDNNDSLRRVMNILNLGYPTPKKYAYAMKIRPNLTTSEPRHHLPTVSINKGKAFEL
jgi:hypothetical protein